ncbi:type VII secretion protein EccB [Nocardia sp. NBC_01377]|uniref:type VII secretion protein EccB n=1 Tax=Nocardia sp. NBC_01377 TaxID=2903595 RepID=UPI0032550929
MPAQMTTRAQVNGYRFLLKRYEHALVRWDVRMLHDPMRSQSRSMIVGIVLGVLVVAGAVILAFIKPQGSVGDSKIVMAKDSGALYVVVDNTLHPVLNLASARLITGSAASPATVKDSKLTMRRGPLLGIPGAPGAMPGSADHDSANWTMCDVVPLSKTGSATAAAGVITTVIAGALDTSEGGARPLAPEQARLVTNSGATYLLYQGRRAQLDPNDAVLSRAMNLDEHTPAPIGAALLNATEPVPPLRAPRIDRLGEPGPGKLSDVPIGGLIRVRAVDAEELYVVLAGGVQPVTPFTAEIIRNANSQGMTDIRSVPPDRIVDVPVLGDLPVQQFPEQTPSILSPSADPVFCITWALGQHDGISAVTLSAGRELPLPGGAMPVVPATADGAGDRVDAVYVRPSTGEFVRSVAMTPGSISNGPMFYLADTGIRYGIPDSATAQVLGLPKQPKPVPKPIIEALAPGPTLARQDALMSHDNLPQCPDASRRAGDCAQPIAVGN